VAREGLPFITLGCGLAVLFYFLGVLSLAILTGIFGLFSIFFFRDPDRKDPFPDKAVLSPADGTIIRISNIEDKGNPLGEPACKISIFMSIFSVHVNRSPIGGTVKTISYNKGKFFSANLDKASDKNERNSITLETYGSRKIVFVQIAGLVARRIVCWLSEGDRVQPGQRIGLIRFGSRLDVYLPRDSKVTASLRQKVTAGKTILGYLQC
jgi:phosphatidylserine decarboxylase